MEFIKKGNDFELNEWKVIIIQQKNKK